MTDAPDPLGTLERVTDSVFHYTSSAGLLGILQGQALWASEAASLNDIGEIRQGWDYVRAWLAGHSSDGADRLGEIAVLMPLSMKEAYVLSASTAGDDANQWRLYGGQIRGYSLELDASISLAVVADGKRPGKKPAKKGSLNIGEMLRYSVGVSPWLKCLYADAAKDRAMRQVLMHYEAERARILSAGYDEDEYDQESTMLRDNALDYLFTIASLIKSDGFAGENEARIVVTPLFRSTYEQFRASDVGIVSYVELGTGLATGVRSSNRVYRGDAEVKPLPIRSVTAGPLLRPESYATLKALMKKSGITNPEVKASKVPLR